MTKILFLFLSLLTLTAQAAEDPDQIFLVTLNKCVTNELNMKEPQDLRLLAAPEMSLVCSRKAQISCRILRKEDGQFQAISEKIFKVYADVGDMGEIRTEDDQHTSLVLNQKLKKAVYSALEITSQSLVRHTVCSGTLKDTREIKKVINPPKKDYEKKSTPVELTPSRIGD
jgi:hypothetical protein